MKNHDISVVIPFYNGAVWIERALKSAFNQSVPAKEVIVVNDGSSADELAALELLGEKYPFVLISKPNGGQGSARNAGVKAATSEFICFLDQDDFYLPNHNKVLLSLIPFEKSNFGFAYADISRANGDGRVYVTNFIAARAQHPKKELVNLISADMYILPTASIISKAAFESVGGFDPDLRGYEDDDLFIRMYMMGYANYFSESSVAVWCIHSSSTTFSILMKQSRMHYINNLMGYFDECEIIGDEVFSKLIYPRFNRLIIGDLFKSIVTRDINLHKCIEIFREFKCYVMRDKNMRKITKLRFALLDLSLDFIPLSAIAVIAKIKPDYFNIL